MMVIKMKSNFKVDRLDISTLLAHTTIQDKIYIFRINISFIFYVMLTCVLNQIFCNAMLCLIWSLFAISSGKTSESGEGSQLCD